MPRNPKAPLLRTRLAPSSQKAHGLLRLLSGHARAVPEPVPLPCGRRPTIALLFSDPREEPAQIPRAHATSTTTTNMEAKRNPSPCPLPPHTKLGRSISKGHGTNHTQEHGEKSQQNINNPPHFLIPGATKAKTHAERNQSQTNRTRKGDQSTITKKYRPSIIPSIHPSIHPACQNQPRPIQPRTAIEVSQTSHSSH